MAGLLLTGCGRSVEEQAKEAVEATFKPKSPNIYRMVRQSTRYFSKADSVATSQGVHGRRSGMYVHHVFEMSEKSGAWKMDSLDFVVTSTGEVLATKSPF